MHSLMVPDEGHGKVEFQLGIRNLNSVVTNYVNNNNFITVIMLYQTTDTRESPSYDKNRNVEIEM